MVLSNLNKTYRDTTDYTLAPVPISHGTENVTNSWLYSNNNRNSFMLNKRGSYSSDSYYYQHSGGSNQGGFYVAVGYGNASENADDYKLSNMQGVDNDLLSHKYGYNKCFRGDSDYPIWVESVYENTGDTNVTVKEIGLVFCPTTYNWSGDWSWTHCNFLIARKVLANPVTIHPNEVYKFIYKMKF